MIPVEKVHVFETAGLGKAPYRFLGVSKNWFTAGPGDPGKPGGSCRYCFTGIAWEFHLESANGKRFHVGSDCIAKTGDKGLKRVVADHERQQRRERDDRIRAEVKALEDQAIARFAEISERFASEPHPNTYYASQGKTKADYFDFMLRNRCGSVRDRKARAAFILERNR